MAYVFILGVAGLPEIVFGNIGLYWIGDIDPVKPELPLFYNNARLGGICGST